jgi:hypothetical protein
MSTREEDVLRRVLASQADAVDVEARALAEIRTRIAERRRRRWSPRTLRGGLLVAAPALAAVIAAAVLVLGSCLPRVPQHTATPDASATARLAPSAVNVPVYYLGAEPVLYREFHRVEVAGGPAQKASAALTQMLGVATARDPDYRGGWPAGTTVRAVRVDGDVVTVDLSGVPAAVAEPAAALQELIWTATAASGTTGVRLLRDGGPVDRLWGQPAGGVLHRGAAAEVLAPVWLIDPQQGAVVGRTFTVYLAGVAPEAMVRLRVVDNRGKVVAEQPVRLDRGAPAQGEAKVTLRLTPGDYVATAFIVSLRDGSERAADNHGFTVR